MEHAAAAGAGTTRALRGRASRSRRVAAGKGLARRAVVPCVAWHGPGRGRGGAAAISGSAAACPGGCWVWQPNKKHGSAQPIYFCFSTSICLSLSLSPEFKPQFLNSGLKLV